MISVKNISKCCMVLALISSSFVYASDWSRQRHDNWVATWGAPPESAALRGATPHVFQNQTIRQIAHTSVGGSRIRVRLSNEFGTQPLKIGAAHVALASSGSAIVQGSDRTLKFGGLNSITIPAGAVALSDPVDFATLARSDVAISIFLPNNTGPATYRESDGQTTYISTAGDFSGANTIPVAESVTSHFFLTAVDVAIPAVFGDVNVVVALGDSIAEGFRSTDDTNRRWTDVLSSRLNARYGRPELGVVNKGIGCGRLLFDFCGPNGSARFDRDVLAVTGRTHVIDALGLVDIIFPTAAGATGELVSAAEIIQGQKQLIERAHAQGILIYGATIIPFGLSAFPNVFTPENEAKRQTINQWIRTSGAYDGVVDFDAAVRNPNDPTKMLSIYSSDDGVHPSDAGYEAMGNSINLALFD